MKLIFISMLFVCFASHFVGQTPGLSLRVNNPIGNNLMLELIDQSTNRNIFIGEDAGLHNTSGNDNTMIGLGTFKWNTTGNNNTAFGSFALAYNTLGDGNTAIGANSLDGATSTKFDFNTAIGAESLRMNIGNNNVANGAYAMFFNTIGYSNTAIGVKALRGVSGNTIGNFNTSTGIESLFLNETGNNNTANGANALHNNSAGSDNTAIGIGAIFSNLTGSCNTAIGSGADVSTSNLTNTTAIGCGAIVNANNQIRLGNGLVDAVLPGNDGIASLGNSSSKWSEVWATNGTIQSSDYRLKSGITNTKYGLNEVMRLRPVIYRWKENPDDAQMLGFIAQEVESIVPEAVVVPKNEGDYYAMKYDALIPVLTKAVQEQQALIEQQNKIIEGQNKKIEVLMNEIILIKG